MGSGANRSRCGRASAIASKCGRDVDVEPFGAGIARLSDGSKCVLTCTFGWCPHWDSNPDLADFKSAASANWAMGASQFRATLGRFRLVRRSPSPAVIHTGWASTGQIHVSAATDYRTTKRRIWHTDRAYPRPIAAQQALSARGATCRPSPTLASRRFQHRCSRQCRPSLRRASRPRQPPSRRSRRPPSARP
ncbi:MAG: hypothetical protein QOH54_300 [Mycobacterium sp.]|nr:hypothetical protein [Mycobacterium sp.]